MAKLTIEFENIPDDWFEESLKGLARTDLENFGVRVNHTNYYKFDFTKISLRSFVNIAASASSLHSTLEHTKQKGGN